MVARLRTQLRPNVTAASTVQPTAPTAPAEALTPQLAAIPRANPVLHGPSSQPPSADTDTSVVSVSISTLEVAISFGIIPNPKVTF